jgi:hypothetical protein
MKTLISLHYLPSLEYFSVLLKSEEVVLDIGENYVKQTYRNRCNILTANGLQTLIIPVINGNSLKKQATKDIKIDYQQNWLNQHWRAIISAYNNAPFFEFFADDFEKIFFKKPVFLSEITLPLLTKCTNFLNLEKKITISETYCNISEEPYKSHYTDLRGVIQPKNHFSQNNFYHPTSYFQVFGNDFEPNLSIIDLMFCQGKQTQNILQQSLQEAKETSIPK